jgi:hypothetical protein
MPTPPELSRCLTLPRERRSTELFRTIDLCNITGLTFFVDPDRCRLMAVHAHSKRQPCAMDTYISTPATGWEGVENTEWIYMPLPSGDEVLRCGPSAERDHDQSGPFMVSCHLQRILSDLKSNSSIRFKHGCPAKLLLGIPDHGLLVLEAARSTARVTPSS